MNEGTRQVMADPSGTAHILDNAGITVAGKTGTAQAPSGQTHAWFTGYFPYDQPRHAICVFLERGGPGPLACVVAQEIIVKMIEQDLA